MSIRFLALLLAAAVPAASAHAASSAMIKTRKKADSKDASQSQAQEPSAENKCQKLSGLSRKRCLSQGQQGGYGNAAAQGGGQASSDPIRARMQKKAGFQAGAAAADAPAAGGGAASAAKGGAAGARATSGGGAAAPALSGVDQARSECMKIALMSARATCLSKLSSASSAAGGSGAAVSDNLVGAQGAGAGGGTLTETQQPVDPNRFKIGTPDAGGGHAVR